MWFVNVLVVVGKTHAFVELKGIVGEGDVVKDAAIINGTGKGLHRLSGFGRGWHFFVLLFFI